MISTRRRFISGLASLGVVGACAGSENVDVDDANAEDKAALRQEIDGRVEVAQSYLYKNVPGAAELRRKSSGVLIIPLITEAGFFYGGAFGRGALTVDRKNVGYYSAGKGSVGLQFGVHQYAHALFFLTDRALQKFRSQNGSFSLGADVTYAIQKEGGAIGVDTESALSSVVAVVFAQAGFVLGVSLAGTKYTKLNL